MRTNTKFVDLNTEDTCEANICDLLNEIGMLKAEVKALSKPTLNHEEASKYLHISPKYLYRLNAKNTIPYYRPNGGKITYYTKDLDKWLMSSKRWSLKELEADI
jgi:excisionase family DNA binding protein